jgi:hypothetical protein
MWFKIVGEKFYFIKKSNRIPIFPSQMSGLRKFRCAGVSQKSTVFQDVYLNFVNEHILYEVDDCFKLNDDDALVQYVNKIFGKSEWDFENVSEIKNVHMLSSILNIFSDQSSEYLEWNQSVTFNCVSSNYFLLFNHYFRSQQTLTYFFQTLTTFFKIFQDEEESKVMWFPDKIDKKETFGKSSLKLQNLNPRHLRAYECLAEYESGTTKAVLMLEKNDASDIHFFLKNYLILPLYSKFSYDDAWPALVLDFQKSIAQIPINSMIEIICSSSTQG